jgi:tetratricopeptide (TPR) repeat protein
MAERKMLKPEEWFRVQMLYGEALIKLDKYSDALDHFKKMEETISFKQRIGDILVQIGLIFYAQNDTLQAADTWRSVNLRFQKTESSSWAFYYLAEMYLKYGNLEKALDNYQKAIDEYRLSQVIELAQEKVDALRKILAIKEELAQAVVPNASEKRIELAEMYVLKLNQPDSAISQYRKILKDTPDDPLAPKAGYALAWTYAFAKNEFSNADREFAQLLKQYPESDYALGAVKYFESRGAALDSTEVRSVGYYFIKAEEYLLTFKNPSRALEFYDIVIDSFPTSVLVPKALAAKAYIYSEYLNNPQLAQETYEIISQKYPQTPFDRLALVRLGRREIGVKPSTPSTSDSILALLRAKSESGKTGEDIKFLTPSDMYADADKRNSGNYADLPKAPRNPLKPFPLEYNYPEQEWQAEFRRKVIKFRIFIDAFCKISKATIEPNGGTGNYIIDQAVLQYILDNDVEFDPNNIKVTDRNQWFRWEHQLEKPYSMRY